MVEEVDCPPALVHLLVLEFPFLPQREEDVSLQGEYGLVWEGGGVRGIGYTPGCGLMGLRNKEIIIQFACP